LQALLSACSDGRVRGKIELVVSNKAGAGALVRAERAGVATLVSSPDDFPNAEEYYAHLAQDCKKRGITLVCLAGFMLKLKSPLLKAFPDRILNIHPSLLPSFGGQGMYGMKVHEAVLASGVKISGATVHIVDEEYDRGPIILQSSVPVLAGDSPQSLSARVRAQEHWIYPKALSLFCEGRVTITGRKAELHNSMLDSSARVRRALISVSDKAGLVEFARGLHELGVEIVSTSGTAKTLLEAGLPIRPLDSMTGFPEILDGRVKTLHPNVHGAILLRRKDPKQAREAELFGLEPIDLVVVNLYPFAKTVAAATSPYEQAVIEQIDIGGVALIRAAAKNFEDVAVITAPGDYQETLAELTVSQGRLTEATRKKISIDRFPTHCRI
jgi:phosphoribosylaminoimidazolecarboxamide formyltransferase/IMP cyclohydrolase